jgi:hypothetical protein
VAPVTTLIEFLRARLDEDEAAARAASPGRWVAAGTCIGSEDHGTMARMAVPSGMYRKRVADAEHIARWDPARVLADCAAKRALLAQHARTEHEGHAWCGHCYGEPAWPCTDLRIMAQPYADRPGFDPAWMVEP